ncbi:restriction endonuclease subunit S [Paludibacterium sp. B53371]|uniref:restriction endonuclease subunit S n=1 Tax=Paludibacterium sp. B53371 TaxID=2806263 RepID=UPI001C05CA6A|nr:restriction endonuclease subunit S [Paludibacterium sp. B53371]
MAYSAYEHYKPTGIKTIGSIPEHWTVRRLKFMARIQNGKDYKEVVADDGFPVIGSGGEFAKASAYLYNGESVLLGRKGTIDRPLYINGPFWTVDTMFYTEVANDVSAKYLYYCALTINFLKYATSTALPSMTQQDLGAIPFALPRHDEQQAIARFLDFKTSQIDALIAKKKTLLDKLAEKRTALISHAVTKGLDPSVAMKESKVEWLGSIPQDWKETRVKFLGDLILGLTYSPDDVVSDGGTLVLRSSNVQEGKISLDDCVYVSCDIPKKVITKADDILICSRNGSRALIGKCALLTEEVSNQAFGAFMTVLRSRHARFLYYVLNSTLFKFQSGRFLTSTINQLTTQTLGDFEIALPPEETQAEIVNHLDKAAAAIDAQCRKAQTVIDRLTEYRSALITNAVTGKIDVRDFAIPHIAEGIAS